MAHARWAITPCVEEKRGAVTAVAVVGHGGDETNLYRRASSWGQSVGTRLPLLPQRYNTANFRHWESAALLDLAGLRLFSCEECVHPGAWRHVLGQLEEMEPKCMVELA
jgi:hypothetical protein